MGRWSRELAPLLVKLAGVRDGDAILDVGSGTGALTAAVASVAPSSRIIGIDPAAPCVAFAQARHRADLIAFEIGDAQQLRFPERSFDRTLSLLVLNFIPDPAKALDEMIRVTRPGGTVSAAVWDYGQEMEMLRAFWDETVALDPSAAAQHERQHMPLSRQGELGALWRNIGCWMCTKNRLPFECSSRRSMTTGLHSSNGKVRQALTLQRSRQATGSSFGCGCVGDSSAKPAIVRSSSRLVRGRCEAPCLLARSSERELKR